MNILEKTPKFGRTVRTLDNIINLKIKFSEAYTQRSMGICKKNQEKAIFRGCLKKNLSIFQVLGTVYFAGCHIYNIKQKIACYDDGNCEVISRNIDKTKLV